MSLEHVEGAAGKREVPPLLILAVRGDPRAAWGEAFPKEGRPWGKRDFPHGSEREASDVVEAHLGKQTFEGGS